MRAESLATTEADFFFQTLLERQEDTARPQQTLLERQEETPRDLNELYARLSQSRTKQSDRAARRAQELHRNVQNVFLDLVTGLQIGSALEACLTEEELRQVGWCCHSALDYLCDNWNMF